ncbi:MAG: PHP domain-containing protein, partial [Gammaproteobacteria bacterium]|nr:PHP domain-containing protein [Gammaproteobacteria bacterium]
MRIDLHSHSTCSDGKLSPAELVARAVEKEVDVLALTDHDTVAGIELARTAIHENSLPLFLVPGVEISCTWDAIEVHVV